VVCVTSLTNVHVILAGTARAARKHVVTPIVKMAEHVLSVTCACVPADISVIAVNTEQWKLSKTSDAQQTRRHCWKSDGKYLTIPCRENTQGNFPTTGGI